VDADLLDLGATERVGLIGALERQFVIDFLQNSLFSPVRRTQYTMCAAFTTNCSSQATRTW